MKRTAPLMAMVMISIVALGGVAFASHDFSDVPDSHPFHDDISWMADAGVTEGFDDGTFRPGQPVTRQAMAAFMRRLAGADPEVDPMVDAALLDGRLPADYDDAVTLQSKTPEDLLPNWETSGGAAGVTITGGTIETANPVVTITLPPGNGRTAIWFNAMVQSSHDSASFFCRSSVPLTDLSTLSDVYIGDGAHGYTNRLPISAFVTTSAAAGTDLTISCYANNRAGTGTVTVITPKLMAIRLGEYHDD